MSSLSSYIPAAFKPQNPFWLACFNSSFGMGTQNVLGVAARVNLTPILLPGTLVISKIGFIQSLAGGAGTFWRLGLYADKGRTPTGGKVLFDSGNVDATIAGQHTVAISPALTLLPGFYWIALETGDGVITYATFIGNQALVEVGSEILSGGFYGRAGGFGALTNPCPAVTPGNLANPVSTLRVNQVLQ